MNHKLKINLSCWQNEEQKLSILSFKYERFKKAPWNEVKFDFFFFLKKRDKKVLKHKKGVCAGPMFVSLFFWDNFHLQFVACALLGFFPLCVHTVFTVKWFNGSNVSFDTVALIYQLSSNEDISKHFCFALLSQRFFLFIFSCSALRWSAAFRCIYLYWFGFDQHSVFHNTDHGQQLI